jgi:hypothetical protein
LLLLLLQGLLLLLLLKECLLQLHGRLHPHAHGRCASTVKVVFHLVSHASQLVLTRNLHRLTPQHHVGLQAWMVPHTGNVTWYTCSEVHPQRCFQPAVFICMRKPMCLVSAKADGTTNAQTRQLLFEHKDVDSPGDPCPFFTTLHYLVRAAACICSS